MKNSFFIVLVLILSVTANSQQNINELLAAGIEDAKRFSTDYISPANNSLAYGINNSWFNNPKTPKQFGFEFSIIGNASFIKDESQSFDLNITEYENIRFPDNSSSKKVATSLGHNNPVQEIIITYEDPAFGNQETTIELPSGLGSTNVNLIPTAFLQASFSPLNGTQIKGRYFPKVDTEDAEIGIYGFGIQQDFTAFFPKDKILPVTVSGLIAYTNLNANYDFTAAGIVDGENQQIETETNTMLYQLIVGTNLKVMNFYGSVGYLNGKNTTNLLGSYIVSDGTFFSEEIIDPFTIESETKGVLATLGTNLKLGFFSLNANYTIAEFNSASLGMNFSF